MDVLTEYSDYTHGMVCVPIIMACREGGVFKWVQQHPRCKASEMAAGCDANLGHLMVAIRALVSIGVLKPGEGLFYDAANELSLNIDSIPRAVMAFYSVDVSHWVLSDGSAECPYSSDVEACIDLVVRRWPGMQSKMIRAF